MISRYIDKYSQIIAHQLAPRYIKFPETDEELNETQRRFEARRGFPSTVGVLDCTHVVMSSANRNQEIALLDRHRNHSINVQIVCDSRLYISNVNARYPGSTHDMFIFNASHLKNRLETRYASHPNQNLWLLGTCFSSQRIKHTCIFYYSLGNLLFNRGLRLHTSAVLNDTHSSWPR